MVGYFMQTMELCKLPVIAKRTALFDPGPTNFNLYDLAGKIV